MDPINEFTITPNSGIKIFFQITNINVDSVTMAFQNQQLADYNTIVDINLENGEQIHNLILSSKTLIFVLLLIYCFFNLNEKK